MGEQVRLHWQHSLDGIHERVMEGREWAWGSCFGHGTIDGCEPSIDLPFVTFLRRMDGA